jgi:hypothetical protein
MENYMKKSPALVLIENSRLDLKSGDEIAYEYVINEGLYAIDTNLQKGILVLPHIVKIGFKIYISDVYGSWKYYPLEIHRNGHRIMFREENMICDVPHAYFTLTYKNPIIGWEVGQS